MAEDSRTDGPTNPPSDRKDEVERLLREAFRNSGARPADGDGVDPSRFGVPGLFEDLRDPKIGGMAIVFRAWDRKLTRVVAYKVMKDETADSGEFRRLFSREAEITASFQFPGIVPVFELVDDRSGRPAYTMGYIEGESFRDLLRRTEMPPLARRLEAFRAACVIVEHAHRRRVVHGDLSLKNLMLAEDGATYVVDWGLARRVGPQSTVATEGNRPDAWSSPVAAEPATHGFTSPKVLAGERPRSESTDVYSLGAVLAGLVAGVTPEGRPDLDGLGRNGTPRALQAIIRAAMVDGEQPPYPTAGVLGEDLERFFKGEKVRVDLCEPWREQAWRAIRHHPARATTGVAAALLLLVVLAMTSLVSAARERSARLEADARHSRESLLEVRIATSFLRCDSLQAEAEARNVDYGDRILGFVLQGIQLTGTASPKIRARAAELSALLKPALRDLRDSRVKSLERRGQNVEREEGQAIEELEAFAREFPERRDLRWAIGSCHVLLGYYEGNRTIGTAENAIAGLLTGKTPEQAAIEAALARIDRGLKMMADAPADLPEPNPYRSRQNFGWEVRALFLASLKRYTEAAMAYDRSLVLSDGDRATLARAYRLFCLLMAEEEQAKLPWTHRGEHSQAIQMADYLADIPEVSSQAVFNSACANALASLDQSASVAERDRRARRAVVLLTRIEAQGDFRGSKPAGNLTNDKDLDPLRQRAEFQALVQRVTKGG
jgi:serine/threonine protein kinase